MARVSTVIPVYNAENTIGETLQSALAQQFEGHEVIVVDDGSTDATPRILQSYSSQIRYVRQDNSAPSVARNLGIRMARGDYIAFLDADDKWLPGRLKSTVASLDANPRAVLAFSKFIQADENGSQVLSSFHSAKPTMDALLKGAVWEILTSAVTLRRSVFLRCGGFPTELPGPGFEDTYAWLLLREYGEFEMVDEPLVVYRASPFLTRVRKYDHSREIFFQMILKRYGRSAKPLVDAVKYGAAAALIHEALDAIDKDNPLDAVSLLLDALRSKPSSLLSFKIMSRILRRRNLGRLIVLLRMQRSGELPAFRK